MFRDPFHEEAHELRLRFTIFCIISTVHPCASTNKWFLVWLSLNLCVHFSRIARHVEPLFDVLHGFCPPPSRSCSTPRGSVHHATWKTSTTRETKCFPAQWVPILYLCERASRDSHSSFLRQLPSFLLFSSWKKLHPTSAATPSSCQFWVSSNMATSTWHWPTSRRKSYRANDMLTFHELTQIKCEIRCAMSFSAYPLSLSESQLCFSHRRASLIVVLLVLPPLFRLSSSSSSSTVSVFFFFFLTTCHETSLLSDSSEDDLASSQPLRIFSSEAFLLSAIFSFLQFYNGWRWETPIVGRWKNSFVRFFEL